MKTLNLKAIMKTQSHFSVGTNATRRSADSHVRRPFGVPPSGGSAPIAQIFNLLDRRIVFCQTAAIPWRGIAPGIWPTASRLHSLLA